MKRTELFTKTSKNAPAGEISKNAQLLIRAGFIYKEMAGVYAYLPLGLRVLENVKQIIREEMNAIGGQEINLTALQNPEVWEKSGRWNDEIMDVWFKTQLKNQSELGLAPTHEEPLTDLMRNFIASYKDLPAYVYQFQTKFRNELRAKSGIMRGREFLMKDLYSFSKDENSHEEFYEKAARAYEKIFARFGIDNITYKTFASGGSFSKFSHEFQTICEVGEDKIYISDEKNIAINEEVLTPEILADLNLKREDLREEKAVEVGNIFTLGTKYSEALGLNFTDENGEINPVFMGSYGIGPSRVMGVLAEIFADEKGLVWPENVAPFKVCLINLGDDEKVIRETEKVYNELLDSDIEVIWDNRTDARAGEKFADAELMGIPHRVVISAKNLENAENDEILEYKSRVGDDIKMCNLPEFIAKLAN